MQLDFSKMHGLGNDFMVINASHQTLQLNSQMIRDWADRNQGIGFDQLLLLEASKNGSDCTLRIFNADGSEAEQCGNGIRCVALFARRFGLAKHNTVKIALGDRVVHAVVLSDQMVQVDMGQPVFEPSGIPFAHKSEAKFYSLTVVGESYKMGVVSLGNPHAVLQVEQLDDYPVAEIGAAIQADPVFPQSVNVGFMQVITRDQIQLRVFERGVGETAACGSGACAAVVIGCLWDLLDAAVCVQMREGQLQIEWQGRNSKVKMTGPAAFVDTGTVTV